MGTESEQTFFQRRHREEGKMFNIADYQVNSNQNHSKIFTPMTIIKKIRNNKCWRGRGGKGTLLHSLWVQSYGKQYGDFSKNYEQNYHIIQLFYFRVFI